jgi:hypothetical protein
MDWGVRRFEGYVIESVHIRNGSGVLALTVHGQNGCILLAVLGQFIFHESFLLFSVGSGSLRNTSSSRAISKGKLVVLVEDWGTFWILVLASSGTRTSSLK